MKLKEFLVSTNFIEIFFLTIVLGDMYINYIEKYTLFVDIKVYNFEEEMLHENEWKPRRNFTKDCKANDMSGG